MKRTGMVKPPLVLTLICLIVTAALAIVYQVTLTPIQEAKTAADEASCRELMPDADAFSELVLPAETTTDSGAQLLAISEASAGGQTIGWVFTAAASGYSGQVTVMCGIDCDGLVTRVKISEHTETPGLGSKVAEPDYTDQFIGADAETSAAIDGITGATFTSVALKEAIGAAFLGYQQIAEVE